MTDLNAENKRLLSKADLVLDLLHKSFKGHCLPCFRMVINYYP